MSQHILGIDKCLYSIHPLPKATHLIDAHVDIIRYSSFVQYHNRHIPHYCRGNTMVQFYEIATTLLQRPVKTNILISQE